MIRITVFSHGFLERGDMAESLPARIKYLPPLNFSCEPAICMEVVKADGKNRYPILKSFRYV